jgi:NIMA (never in mitosis gene a)-related kinase 9
LGHGKNSGFTRIAKQVDYFNGISIEQVECGEEFTCCVSEDGDLFSFGSDYMGCLGLGGNRDEDGESLFDASNDNENDESLSNNSVYTPVRISFFYDRGLKIKKIACGDNHVIALTTDNQIFTWGCGEYGRLGHGDEENSSVPKKINFRFNYVFKDIFAGIDNSFLLTKEGKLLAFGNNEYNKLCLNYKSIEFKSSIIKYKDISMSSNDIIQQLEPKIVQKLAAYNIFKVYPGLNHTAIIDCK